LEFVELLIYPRRQDIGYGVEERLFALIAINLYNLLYLGIAINNLQVVYPVLGIQSLRLGWRNQDLKVVVLNSLRLHIVGKGDLPLKIDHRLT